MQSLMEHREHKASKHHSPDWVEKFWKGGIMSNREAKRQLCGLPGGKNTLADMQFSVRHIAPKTEGRNLAESVEFFTAARSPNQHLTGAVTDSE